LRAVLEIGGQQFTRMTPETIPDQVGGPYGLNSLIGEKEDGKFRQGDQTDGKVQDKRSRQQQCRPGGKNTLWKCPDTILQRSADGEFGWHSNNPIIGPPQGRIFDHDRLFFERITLGGLRIQGEMQTCTRPNLHTNGQVRVLQRVRCLHLLRHTIWSDG